MTFPSAPVSTLHRSGFFCWSASTSTSKKAWVSFFVTSSINGVWKYSCSGREAPLSTWASSWVSRLWLLRATLLFRGLGMLGTSPCIFLFPVRLWWAINFPPMIFLTTCTTNWSKCWTQGSLRNIKFRTTASTETNDGATGLPGVFAALGGAWPSLRASIRVELSVAIRLIWLLVTSSVLAISKAVSRVGVVSFSRSLVCVRL